MSDIELGKKYFIHSYKHDGTIHRSWDEAVLLDIKDNYLVRLLQTRKYIKSRVFSTCYFKWKQKNNSQHGQDHKIPMDQFNGNALYLSEEYNKVLKRNSQKLNLKNCRDIA